MILQELDAEVESVQRSALEDRVLSAVERQQRTPAPRPRRANFYAPALRIGQRADSIVGFNLGDAALIAIKSRDRNEEASGIGIPHLVAPGHRLARRLGL